MSLSILHLHDISAIAMDKPLFDDYRNNIFKSCELSQPLLVLSLLVDWRVEDAIPVDEHLLRAPELRAGEDGSGEARLEREAYPSCSRPPSACCPAPTRRPAAAAQRPTRSPQLDCYSVFLVYY